MGDIKFKTMRNAFCGAEKLVGENFVSSPGIADTSSLINIYAAFRGTSLTKLDLNHWDTSSLLHMNAAFSRLLRFNLFRDIKLECFKT